MLETDKYTLRLCSKLHCLPQLLQLYAEYFPTTHRKFSTNVGSRVVEHGMQHLTEATPEKVHTDSEIRNRGNLTMCKHSAVWGDFPL